MHHRSHDREALDRSTEPGPSPGSGSTFIPDSSPDDLRVRLHEAANWLAVLRGRLDLARSGAVADAETLESLHRALEGAERALAGRPGPDRLAVDVGVLAREVAADARALRPSLRLSVEAPPPDALVGSTDPQALRDVFLNLIRNAAEVLDDQPGGSVRVRVQPLGGARVAFAVEDDGPGMTEDVRARCLEPGFSTKGSGRGIGLARVASLVAGLGGTLEVWSRLGQGTRFAGSFELDPARVETDAASPDMPASVLVVDDDPDVREVLVDMIETLDVGAVEALDAVEDLMTLCRAQTVDVVLLDRDLGTLRGDHLAIEVRQVDPAVAIVLLTGDPITPGAAPPGAFDAVVTKPVGLDALRRQLQDAHALTRRRRSHGLGRARRQEDA